MTPREKIEAMADELQTELVLIEGYDDCIVGVAQQFDRIFVVYDQTQIINKLMESGMTWEQARDHYAAEQADAQFGDETPAFLWALTSVRKRSFDA